MVFKLVRTDSEEPCKIKLPLGSHLVGRGKFLECDDRRVSRNHLELTVTDDTVTMKALHQNPCFYMKKETEETQIIKQNITVSLSHGDKFGLLPDSYWYQVLHCTLLDRDQSPDPEGGLPDVKLHDEASNESDETENINRTDYEQGTCDINATITERKDEPSMLNRNSPTDNGDEDGASIQSSSLTPNLQLNECEGSPSILAPDSGEKREFSTQDHKLDHNEVQNSPSKRSLSNDGQTAEAKRIKPEPQDGDAVVKQEPDAQPGPSNDQADSSQPDPNNAAPINPQLPQRERCMYGANCYRRNPQHKAQFSHPSDQDWGPGDRGVCPYGKACQKRDPRHWRDHEHPNDAQRPGSPRPGMRMVQRNGNIFYINAHTVNFYDDHVQLEDSDGDSVDFDYEF